MRYAYATLSRIVDIEVTKEYHLACCLLQRLLGVSPFSYPWAGVSWVVDVDYCDLAEGGVQRKGRHVRAILSTPLMRGPYLTVDHKADSGLWERLVRELVRLWAVGEPSPTVIA